MMLHHSDKKIFLHPGDFHFTKKDAHLHTLLGSCIAITLWHPKLKYGGMCHYKLPTNPARNCIGGALNGNYADEAMDMFVHESLRYGTPISEYQAKIFGGGNMIKTEIDDVFEGIGAKNSAAAMQLLMNSGVNIHVAHVGEFGHRRIVFDVSSGEVWVRHVDKNGDRASSINGMT